MKYNGRILRNGYVAIGEVVETRGSRGSRVLIGILRYTLWYVRAVRLDRTRVCARAHPFRTRRGAVSRTLPGRTARPWRRGGGDDIVLSAWTPNPPASPYAAYGYYNTGGGGGELMTSYITRAILRGEISGGAREWSASFTGVFVVFLGGRTVRLAIGSDGRRWRGRRLAAKNIISRFFCFFPRPAG